MQVVQVPNIALNNLWVENVTRSKAMKEVIDVNVSFDTSFEDIELLRAEMEKFVRSPENSRDFQPDIGIGVGGIGDLDKLTLKVAIKHKSNWHNDTVRATRRSKFMCALTLALKKVPIYAPGGGGEALGGPKNPAYSVAVTDEYAISARAQADKEKEAKRMDYADPEKQAENASEQKAADHFNTTNPAVDALDDWGYEETLSGRDASTVRPSTSNGPSSRSELLLGTRESQRGRRRAGETVPMTLGDASTPGVQLTRAPTTSTRGGPSFDVERQAGADAPAGSPYTTWTAYNSQTGQQQGVSQPYSPPQQSANLTVQAPPRPGQSPAGARPRGASVSNRPQAPTGDGRLLSGGQSSGGPPPPPSAPGPSSARY